MIKTLFKNRIVLVVACMLLICSSCEDFLGDDINRNPNSPADVPVTALLPAAQVFVADVYGGDFSRFASVIVQQTEGVARQWTSINNYSSMNPATFNTAWNNVYEDILFELNVAKQKASDLGYENYEGVVNIMIAYTLLMSADVWDNIPYSEAFQGADNFSPIFDTQAEIYAEVNTLLNDSFALLQGVDGGVSVGGEDLIYGGGLANWEAAAHSILARMHLHNGDYAQALTSLSNGFTSAAQNMDYQYPDAAAASQWYRFNRDREGDIEIHPTIVGLMEGLNDTDRLAMFSPTFETGHPYFVPDYNQELITFRELKFMEAECLLRTGGADAAIRDAYLAGIEASFARVGVSGSYAAYVAQAAIDPGVGNITLDLIMTQKYIGLFTDPEVFSDWRRTNIPVLSPTSGANVPVRFPYGSDETLFNANAPEEDDVNIFTDRVGWNR